MLASIFQQNMLYLIKVSVFFRDFEKPLPFTGMPKKGAGILWVCGNPPPFHKEVTSYVQQKSRRPLSGHTGTKEKT